MESKKSENTGYIKLNIDNVRFGKPCLICGETVIVDKNCKESVVCDECKNAILHLKKILKGESNERL